MEVADQPSAQEALAISAVSHAYDLQTEHPQSSLNGAANSSNTHLHKAHQPSASLSKVSAILPLKSDTHAAESESQIQQTLYDFINREPRSDLILARIARHHHEGKPLSWFQDIIPELVPGIEGTAQWLAEARRMLWDDKTQTQHVRERKRTSALNQDLPALPPDDYGLRRYWSVLIESLQPMSQMMAVEMDKVSLVIGRSDCLLLKPDRTWITMPTESPVATHDFVAVRQAVQDKILSPLIDDSVAQLKETEAEVAGQTSKFNDLQSDKSSAHERKDFERKQQYLKELNKALLRLRTIVVDEKDMRDKGSAGKRRKEPGSPSEETGSAKRQERM